MILSLVMLGIFLIAMLSAALSDLTSYTIPNWISLFLLAAFFPVIIYLTLMTESYSWADFGWHMIVGIGSLIVMMAMFAFGWIGGGDAKLFAATAFWWMPSDLLTYTVYTTLAGGVLALMLMFGRRFLPVRIATTGWVHRLLREEKKMPYGLALAFAAMLTLPKSALYLAARGF